MDHTNLNEDTQLYFISNDLDTRTTNKFLGNQSNAETIISAPLVEASIVGRSRVPVRSGTLSEERCKTPLAEYPAGINSIPTRSNRNVGVSVRINVIASIDTPKQGAWWIIEVRELTIPNVRAKPKQTAAVNRSVDTKRQAAAGRYVCREVLDSSNAVRVIQSILVASTATAARAGYEIDGAAAIELVVLGTLGYAGLGFSLAASFDGGSWVRDDMSGSRLVLVINGGLVLEEGNAFATFFDGGSKDEAEKHDEGEENVGETHDVEKSYGILEWWDNLECGSLLGRRTDPSSFYASPEDQISNTFPNQSLQPRC